MDKSMKRVSLLYVAKEKINDVISESTSISQAYDLQKLQQSIENWERRLITNSLKSFLKKYGSLSKSELWEALYELMEIFRDIDEDYNKEAN